MRVLVTGGAGFIGSHVVAHLIAQGLAVTVLDDLSTGSRDHLPRGVPDLRVLVGSVLDEAALREALAGCQAVCHLAALVSVAGSVERPLEVHQVNATGTLLVLEAARRMGCARVVVASSAAVYGDAASPCQKEDDPPAPASPYAASKLAAEAYAQAYARSYDLTTCILRLFNVYGPRQAAGSPYAGAIARLSCALASGQEAVVYGDGHQSRDFVHVRDVARAVEKALLAPVPPGRVYNVGTGRATSVLELLEAIAAALGISRPAVRYAPPRPGDVRRSLADVSRAQRELGWQSAIPLADGLAETCSWYAAQVRRFPPPPG